MTKEYAHIEVAVPLPVFKTYTYTVPEALQPDIAPGKRVLVPFGNRKMTGYALGAADPASLKRIKPILEIIDELPLFPASMIPLFKWISDYYIHPLGEVIKEALPGGININECITLHITESGAQTLSEGCAPSLENDILFLIESDCCRIADIPKKLNREVPGTLILKMEKNGLIARKRELKKAIIRQKMERYIALSDSDRLPEKLSEPKRAILELAETNGEISVFELKQSVPTAAAHIRDLAQKNLISVFEKPVYRDPFGEPVPTDSPPKLTLEQHVVVSSVIDALGNGFRTFLLAGVTGSGKTEVYMHIAAEALKKQLSVLVLVPEIALISEIERRFRARFGECVAVLHSGLSSGERYDQWVRVVNNGCPIVIGARSAIFAPLTNIGVIIVDEEHDTSYKQESRFRYNARDMAIIRARLEGGITLLGSATPSIQSIYNVSNGKFNELNLKNRIFSRTLPEISVVDLRNHKDYRGTRRFITTDLQEAMKETLDRNEQVLLFLNRRGFASYPVCACCGEALKCKHCDITLTLHQNARVYKCHLCGYILPSTAACSVCGSSSIKRLGLGTEKIETTVKGLFPESRVARMDRDTITRKGALLKLLKNLRNREIDILIGTQMVAKGHDFPGITLVGIICADLSLSFPDFRAGELTFQVLAQVSGRAGRGKRPGRVILQTYNPDHFSITAATEHDFMRFYNQEITFRETFNYPPFSRMIQLKISGRNRDKVRQKAADLGEQCAALKKKESAFKKWVDILGPIEAPVARIANRHRWQMIIKSKSIDLLHQFARELLFSNGQPLSASDVRIDVDVDPFFMM